MGCRRQETADQTALGEHGIESGLGTESVMLAAAAPEDSFKMADDLAVEPLGGHEGGSDVGALVGIEAVEDGGGGGRCCGGAEPLQDVTAFHTASPLDEVLHELVVVGLPGDEHVRGGDEPIYTGQYVRRFGFKVDVGRGWQCDWFAASRERTVVRLAVVLAVEEIRGTAPIDASQAIEASADGARPVG